MAVEIPIIKNNLQAATETTRKFISSKSKGEEIAIPRTSLAIFAAIITVFKEERTEENLKKIGDLSPLMIALNEAADIGISAKLKIEKGNLPQNKLWGLLLLKGQVFKCLKERKAEFLERYPEERQIIENVEKDFLSLSELRGNFNPDEWPSFLEIDSAIFVCTYLAIINPKILEEAGIEINNPATTKEELEKKYQLFLLDKDENRLTETQKKVRALLASEMILKINDDQNDQKCLQIDDFLDLPSFAKYANHKNPSKPKEVIRSLKTKYQKIAEPYFPQIVQKSAEVLCNLTSITKAKKSKEKLSPQDDPTNFWGCFIRKHQTTTLRHELEAMTIISNLF